MYSLFFQLWFGLHQLLRKSTLAIKSSTVCSSASQELSLLFGEKQVVTVGF